LGSAFDRPESSLAIALCALRAQLARAAPDLRAQSGLDRAVPERLPAIAPTHRHMRTDIDHEDILGALYDAATSPAGWRAALTELTRWTGANEFHLLRWNSATQQPTFNLHSHGVEAAIEQYGAYYGSIDPRRMLVAAGPIGQVSACQREFADSFVEGNEFYQDFLGAWGMRRSLSSLLVHDGDEHLMLGLIREGRRGSFEDEQIARLDRVMPHLQRACRIWMDSQRLREQVALGDEAAGSAGLAWIGVDCVGTLVHANAPAERLLREDDSLVVRGGRLHATDADDAARLQSAIAQAARGLPASELTLRGRRCGPHAFTVSVAGCSMPRPGGAEVLVVLRPRDAVRAPSAELLAQAFGLTSAEAKVALALLDGKTPTEYADAAQLSMATVRTHLSAIYAKTCTRRQAEAVQVLRALQF
jgi:DNA-binding CsgD family transcriptional regulator